MFERKKALKEIEEKLNTVQMYLENNYKDMIQKKMAEFDAKLVHYGHTNVSEFLKERY